MKKLFVVLGYIGSIFALILAATPLFKIAVFPILVGFVCGLGLLYLSKKTQQKTKTSLYILFLTTIAISVLVYKTVFYKAEVADTEAQIIKEDQSEEDAIELLEAIEIDE